MVTFYKENYIKNFYGYVSLMIEYPRKYTITLRYFYRLKLDDFHETLLASKDSGTRVYTSNNFIQPQFSNVKAMRQQGNLQDDVSRLRNELENERRTQQAWQEKDTKKNLYKDIQEGKDPEALRFGIKEQKSHLTTNFEENEQFRRDIQHQDGHLELLKKDTDLLKDEKEVLESQNMRWNSENTSLQNKLKEQQVESTKLNIANTHQTNSNFEKDQEIKKFERQINDALGLPTIEEVQEKKIVPQKNEFINKNSYEKKDTVKYDPDLFPKQTQLYLDDFGSNTEVVNYDNEFYSEVRRLKPYDVKRFKVSCSNIFIVI